MMRRIWAVVMTLVLLTLPQAGCVRPELEPEVMMPPIPSMPALVQEYGEQDTIVEHGDFFNAYVVFPKGDVFDIDREVYSWANKTYESAKATVELVHEGSRRARGELSVQYCAYAGREGYVGVEQFGYFTHTGLTQPIAILKTFNLDVENEKVIKNEVLMPEESRPEILRLLGNEVEKQAREQNATAPMMDDSWLTHPLIREDGIEFLLEAEEGGSLERVFLPYEKMQGLISLVPDEAPEPTPEVTPTPEPTPEATPTPEAELPHRAEIDPTKPMVALSFDDGPSSKTTPKVLEILSAHGGVGTFCVVGNMVGGREETAAQVIAQGSELASHTWSHKDLTTLSAEGIRQEVQASLDAVTEATGVTPTMVRPPYGAMNDNVNKVIGDMGLSTLFWSVDPMDWLSRDPDKVFKAVMDNVEDGSIILLHDIHEETVEALEKLVPALVAEGYQLVTVSELITLREGKKVPGKVYYSVAP